MHGSSRHLFAAFVGIGLIFLIWLAPDIGTSQTSPTGTVEAYRGRIEAITFPSTDPGSDAPPVPIAHVRILDGPRESQAVDAYLAGPGGSQDTSTYAAGQEVVVTFTVQADGSDPYIEVSDHWRIPGLGILGLIFAAAVVFVGGWRGVRALVALGLTAVVILKVLIPAIVNGVPPVPLAVLVASAVTIVTILLTEGLSRTSLVAILGTTSALAITALLAAAATAFLGFTYTAGSDLAFMTVPGGAGLDLRGVLLAAIILGSVGVLDDVTVTQAVLVEELVKKGDLRGPALVVSAMRIGRSHIGATVNTLFLAYVSVGLPLIIVLYVSHQPSGAVLNDETIATEIVRTLIGSLGIIAAIPITTFVAGLLMDGETGDEQGWETFRSRSLSRLLVAIAGIIALLVVTAVVPLGGQPRAPITSNALLPNASSAASAFIAQASPSSDGSALPSATADTTPELFDTGQTVPITVDGQSAGTVAVVPKRTTAADKSHVSVTVHYVATGPFPLAAGRWELLFADGALVPLVTSDPTAAGRTLTAGDRFDLQAAADITPTTKDVFVVYVDTKTSDMILAVPVD